MILNYFDITDDKETLKQKYKEQAKKYHPDIYGEGGNAIMQNIHSELDYCMKHGKAQLSTGKEFTWTDLVNEIMDDIRQRKPAMNTLGQIVTEPMYSFWKVLLAKTNQKIFISDSAVPRVNRN